MVHVVVVIRCIVVFIIFLNCFKTYSGITSRIPVTGGINNFLLVCRNWLSYAYWRSDYIQSSSSIYWWAQLTSLILSNITSVSFWSLLDIKLKFYTFLPVSRCFRWNIYKRSRIKSKRFSIEVANNRRNKALACSPRHCPGSQILWKFWTSNYLKISTSSKVSVWDTISPYFVFQHKWVYICSGVSYCQYSS